MNNYVFSPQIELLNFSVFLCLFVRLFLIERLGSKPCLWLHSLTVMNGCKCWPTVNNQTSALSDWCKQTTENNKQLWTFGDFWWTRTKDLARTMFTSFFKLAWTEELWSFQQNFLWVSLVWLNRSYGSSPEPRVNTFCMRKYASIQVTSISNGC